MNQFGFAVACGLLCIVTPRTAPAATSAGTLDETFITDGTTREVRRICLQSDGRVLVTSLPSGQSADIGGLSRFMTDGAWDQSFKVGRYTGFINAIAEQRDGKLHIGGNYSSYDNHVPGSLLRLNRDGTTDTNFLPALPEGTTVLALNILADDKLLVAGMSAQRISSLWRLNTDGTVDSAFSPTPTRGIIAAMDVAADRIYLGSVPSEKASCADGLGVLRLDGTRAPEFKLRLHRNCTNNEVQEVIPQADGKVIVVGALRLAGRAKTTPWLRLKADGSIDHRFKFRNLPRNANGDLLGYSSIHQTFVLSDGRWMVSGYFSQMGRTPLPSIARFLPDGSLDSSFHSGFSAGDTVYDFAVQPDGKIIVAGNFTSIDGTKRRCLARLNGDNAPALPTIEFTTPYVDVSERNESVTVNITRTGDTAGAALVTAITADDTALDLRDYEHTSTVFRFAAGETSRSFSIPLHDDSVFSGTRAFIVNLTNAVGAILGSNAATRVQIHDDEINNEVQFAFDSFAAAESAPNVRISVTRQTGSTGTLTVGFATHDGSARDGEDYVGTNGLVAFADGENTASFEISLLHNPNAQGNRSFSIDLLPIGNGASFGSRSNTTVTLLDVVTTPVFIDPTEGALRAALSGKATHIQFAAGGIAAMRQPIDVRYGLTIDGSAGPVVLSGGGVVRMFNVAEGVTLTLKNLTLADGFATNGGAIWNEGNLVLDGCTFSNNVARGTDGRDGDPYNGLPRGNGGTGSPAQGGAVVNNGSMTLSNCSFIANQAVGGRGGDGGQGAPGATDWGGVYEGGYGGDGASAEGGAIYSTGEIKAHNTSFFSNSALGGRSGRGGLGGLTNFPPRPGWYYAFYSNNSGTNGAVSGAAFGGAVGVQGRFEFSLCNFYSNSVLGAAGADGQVGQAGDYQTGHAGMDGTPGAQAKGGAVYGTSVGIISGCTFSYNLAHGGQGGAGGKGGSGYPGARADQMSLGGKGGNGSAGGNASGAALCLTEMEAILLNNVFVGNIATGGAGGWAGSGGNAGYLGDGGTGGSGGSGGCAFGGALSASRLRMFGGNSFNFNAATSGSGGDGAPAGGGSGRYGSSGPAGQGGDAGAAEGGACFVEVLASPITFSDFVGNSAAASAGGRGADGGNRQNLSGFSSAGGWGAGGGNGGIANGGALSLRGSTTFSNCLFASNLSHGGDSGAGGHGGNANTQPAGQGGPAGTPGSSSGGALFTTGELTLIDTAVKTNTAIGGDGGRGGNSSYTTFAEQWPETVGRGAKGVAGGDGRGGGIAVLSNHLSLMRSPILGNLAHGGHGGNAGTNGPVNSSFITGPGSVGGIGGTGLGGGIFIIAASGEMTDCELDDNQARGGDGGTSAPAGSSYWSYSRTYPGWPSPVGPPGGAAGGGGIFFQPGWLNIKRCTFSQNATVAGRGGAGGPRQVSEDDGGMGGFGGDARGGAIDQNDGILLMENSTFSANGAQGGNGGPGGAYFGGAVGGTGGSGVGGAICSTTGVLWIASSSFAGNYVLRAQGGIGGSDTNSNGGRTGTNGLIFGETLANEFAGAFVVNSLFQGIPENQSASGFFSDAGNNISSDDSFHFFRATSRNNTDTEIASLSDNGGPTLTLPLLPSSPAVDAANDILAPPMDQRGIRRPVGPHADIGAFEFDPKSNPVSLTKRPLSTLAAIKVRLESTGNALTVRVTADASIPLLVETSTDLVHWTTFTELIADAHGTAQSEIPRISTDTQRYFRVLRR